MLRRNRADHTDPGILTRYPLPRPNEARYSHGRYGQRSLNGVRLAEAVLRPGRYAKMAELVHLYPGNRLHGLQGD